MVWRSPASTALRRARMKWFEHLPTARDADVCCATTFPTKNKKSEPDATAGKAMHSASHSRWSIQKKHAGS